MQKYIIIFSIWMEENKSYVKDPRTKINIQIDGIKWKIMILEKSEEKALDLELLWGINTNYKF